MICTIMTYVDAYPVASWLIIGVIPTIVSFFYFLARDDGAFTVGGFFFCLIVLCLGPVAFLLGCVILAIFVLMWLGETFSDIVIFKIKE